MNTDPLMTAQEWMHDGKEVAIATVLQTWGAAPRPVGSQMVIAEGGRFEGSVSGGCVERDIVSASVQVIETGEPKVLEFDVKDEAAWQAGLSCGGRIKIYLERLG